MLLICKSHGHSPCSSQRGHMICQEAAGGCSQARRLQKAAHSSSSAFQSMIGLRRKSRLAAAWCASAVSHTGSGEHLLCAQH